MLFTVHVIKGCPYCDAILSIYPSLVKRYPKVYFNMKCDEPAEVGTIYPYIEAYHLGHDGVYKDKKESVIYIKDVADFVERSLTKVDDSEFNSRTD